MTEQQKAVILAIIQRAIADGCVVSVHDGDDYAIKESRDPEAILACMGKFEEEWLSFYNNVGRAAVGGVLLVYSRKLVVQDYSWITQPYQGNRMKEIVGARS